MDTFKARGIVLKETIVGESDKILVLLLKDFGKISVSARGARKPKSKFLAGAQLFTYSDFVVYDGGKFMSLAQVDIIESFYDIRNDYDRLVYGTYFLELCDKIIMQSVECNEMLLLLLRSLSALIRGKLEPELIARIFEFKFLQLNGYGAEVEFCAECGCEIEEFMYFSSNGCICRDCNKRSPRSTIVSVAAVKAIEYILCSDLSDLFSFKVSTRVLAELKAAADLFIDAHLDVKIKSRELIEED